MELNIFVVTFRYREDIYIEAHCINILIEGKKNTYQSISAASFFFFLSRSDVILETTTQKMEQLKCRFNIFILPIYYIFLCRDKDLNRVIR